MQTSGVPFFISGGGSGSGAGSLPTGGTAGQYLRKASGTNYDATWYTFALVNADIDAAAAISWSKIDKTGSSLADLTTRSASDLSSGTLPDARFPATLPATSGVNLTNLNASNLASGTVPLSRLSGITTTELSASAGIVDTQLATIATAGKVSNSATTATSANTVSTIVARDASGNFAGGTITATTFSGSGASLTSLPAGNLTGTVPLSTISGLTNTQVAAGAAIAYSKLSLTGSIVNADVATGAAIAYSKLSLSGSIVNADVATGAAIAYSKLSLSSSIVDADVSASAAIAWSKISKTSSSLADLATRTTANLTDFPSQTSNAGKFLKTDGSSLSWATPSGSGGGFAAALLFGGF